MIQRIQSVWLLIAAICVFITIKLTFYSGTDKIDLLYRQVTGTSNLFILILSSALGTCALVTIFLFRQRKLQSRLVWVCIVVECLIIYLYYRQTTFFETGTYGIGAILHPIIIILFVLALRGIYKDAKLIRESNRLR